ncbi:hypothetical protein PR048_004970 [Dryococelus australis]|uniref:Retrovirus-related Pol polyprotein from transposon TNT 1-94-like beta-barrel domain-containing protein n=1 Tax=Dryococelus australis TaxID=614101 RepID=A0ABQ9I806_9NEOP|nr:hypothetical protein PR048_004970 [Dryococelus australis]
MASEKVKYPLLSDDNHHAWVRRTHAGLEQRRLWEAIDPGYDEDPEKLTPKQRTRDPDALNFIIQVVEDQYLNDLDQCAHAKTAWEILESIHEQESSELKAFMSKMNLRSITENRQIHTEDDYRSVEIPRVGLSYRRKFEKPEAEQRNIVCYACNEIGQIERVCPKVTTEGKNNKTKPDHKGRSSGSYTPKGAHAAEGEYENTTLDDDDAVATAHFKALCANKLGRSVDYGATHHMTPYRELIEDFDGSLTRTVKLANGECATVKGKRNVTLVMTEKCGAWTIQLSEEIYVLELENNLMSIKQLDEKKLELRIKDGEFKVMDRNGMIFKAFSGGSVVYLVSCQAYIANGKIVKCDSVKGNLPTSMTAMKLAVTWHRRMRHLKSLPAVCDTSISYRA